MLPYACGSSNVELDFNLSSNDGESSSILNPLDHKTVYPNISFLDKIKVQVKRFDSLIDQFDIDINSFNIIISDTQGYELEVLKGFGNYLNNPVMHNLH
mgnify:CR=1 FL=1